MATNVPASVWRPTNGLSEMGADGEELLVTLANVQLTTLAGVNLITLNGSYTSIPTSIWVEDDSV